MKDTVMGLTSEMQDVVVGEVLPLQAGDLVRGQST